MTLITLFNGHSIRVGLPVPELDNLVVRIEVLTLLRGNMRRQVRRFLVRYRRRRWSNALVAAVDDPLGHLTLGS